jgi:hypothetical protein
MSVRLIREAAEILSDPQARDPEDMQKVAAELRELAEGADLIIGFSAQEARAMIHATNTMGTAYRGILQDMGRDEPDKPAPLRTAAMRIEVAMITEQIPE